jgi:hypothetical protein
VVGLAPGLPTTDEELVAGATALPDVNAQASVPMDVSLSPVIDENLLLTHGLAPGVAESMGTTPREIFYYSRRQTTTAN